MEPNDRQVAAFRRFLEELPHGKDIELVILKAHLLIEEQINIIIKNHVANQSALDRIKLTSEQAILLAQALLPVETDQRFWRAAIKLNTIRNKIAHVISPIGLQHKIQDFISSVPVDWHGSNDQETFELSLWFLFVHISSFVESELDPFIKICVPEMIIEN